METKTKDFRTVKEAVEELRQDGWRPQKESPLGPFHKANDNRSEAVLDFPEDDMAPSVPRENRPCTVIFRTRLARQ